MGPSHAHAVMLVLASVGVVAWLVQDTQLADPFVDLNDAIGQASQLK
tara:strand:- start:15 stop:155 length:141 start_codon:yes stop_codon:yes gene_type:complete